MYLSIMLIIVTSLVFYNEIKSNMNTAEILLLGISLIAIIRASLNYINISDTIDEGFTNSKPKRTTKHTNKNTHKNMNTETDIINLLSSKNNISQLQQKKPIRTKYNQDEYFDTDDKDDKDDKSYKINTKQNFNTVNKDAVNQINSILGISHFDDINMSNSPPQIQAQYIGEHNNNSLRVDNDIDSVYEPQIIIGNNSIGANGKRNNTGNGTGAGNSNDKWNTSFTTDNMTFNNTFKPTHNLWGSDTEYSQQQQQQQQQNQQQCNSNDGNSWTESLDDYNNGKWDKKFYANPNDYIDYIDNTKSNNANTISQKQSNTKTDNKDNKKCGKYNNMSEDSTGNLVVSEYTESKKWVPGYTYVPPIHWDVPQKHIGICQPNNNQKYSNLLGIVDRGLPLNVLELNPDGKIADTEDTAVLSNVGSLIPRFNYQEQPFSKPYI